jgi:hypothetical protein
MLQNALSKSIFAAHNVRGNHAVPPFHEIYNDGGMEGERYIEITSLPVSRQAGVFLPHVRRLWAALAKLVPIIVVSSLSFVS